VGSDAGEINTSKNSERFLSKGRVVARRSRRATKIGKQGWLEEVAEREREIGKQTEAEHQTESSKRKAWLVVRYVHCNKHCSKHYVAVIPPSLLPPLL
jgi:hypothetical protein